RGGGTAHPRLGSDVPDGLVLGGVVGAEGIDRHHRADAVQLDIGDLLAQILRTGVHVVRVLRQHLLRQGFPGHHLVPPGVQLQGPYRGTTTAASGTRPEVRHLRLKKRSAPISAPKPASVTRKSPLWIPIRSATTEELPVAILPNGPQCTSAGVFSRVCSRFGFRASRSSTVITPAASSCSA